MSETEKHEWFIYRGFECCKKCGAILRADKQNLDKKCRGVAKIVLRDKKS